MPKTYPQQLTVAPHELRANLWNVNSVSPENEEKLTESVRQFGMFKPVIVREAPDEKTKYEILGGEHRWLVAKNQGTTKIPIFNLGPIDDDTAKKITLADNARYGSDDVLQLADLLKSLGPAADIQVFLPFTEADISTLFATSDIALDDLELPESFEEPAAEPKAERVPKTHTIMRFKIALADAERITEMITKTQKHQSFTASDDLTNAGDALVHLLSIGATDEP